MKNVMGIVNLHKSISLGTLTNRRPIASTGLLGRYCFIDFALSNFTNSGVQSTSILIKEKPRSLFRHLRFGGKEWALNTKNGGLTLLYNEQFANNQMYNHDINNILENRWLINESKAEYFIFCPCHMIFKLDYRKVIDQHIKNKSEITLVYKSIDNARSDFIGSDFIELDEDLNVQTIKENKGSQDQRLISLETYVISRRKLLEILKIAVNTSAFFTLRDTLNYISKTTTIQSYEYLGYLRSFDSVNHYLQYSLELIQPQISCQLFSKDWPIYTITHDTPPVKYGTQSKVSNCYIANGSIIEGEVENSIIGRGVKIGKGTIIKNSIILSKSVVTEDAYLENTIIDKEATVSIMKNLVGTKKEPLVVKQEDIV